MRCAHEARRQNTGPGKPEPPTTKTQGLGLAAPQGQGGYTGVRVGGGAHRLAVRSPPSRNISKSTSTHLQLSRCTLCVLYRMVLPSPQPMYIVLLWYCRSGTAVPSTHMRYAYGACCVLMCTMCLLTTVRSHPSSHNRGSDRRQPSYCMGAARGIVDRCTMEPLLTDTPCRVCTPPRRTAHGV